MDRYGHLFPDDMDRLAGGLDAVHRRALAAPPRPKGNPTVVEVDGQGG